jgi:hypothetical protein
LINNFEENNELFDNGLFDSCCFIQPACEQGACVSSFSSPELTCLRQGSQTPAAAKARNKNLVAGITTVG